MLAYRSIIFVFILIVFTAITIEGNDKVGQCPRPLAPREGQDRNQNSGGCENECSRDSDCRNTKKCCSNYCGGKSCTEPLTINIGEPDKDGQCPANVNQIVCRRECERDSDCRNDNKCCRSNCGGTKCSDPIRVPTTTRRPITTTSTRRPITTTTTRRPNHGNERPGHCPSGLTQFNCQRECTSDTQCPMHFKCCPTVCHGAKCVNTNPAITTRDPPRPGCPIPSAHPDGFNCRSGCSSDRDCKRKEKCCANQCGALVCTKSND